MALILTYDDTDPGSQQSAYEFLAVLAQANELTAGYMLVPRHHPSLQCPWPPPMGEPVQVWEGVDGRCWHARTPGGSVVSVWSELDALDVWHSIHGSVPH